MSFIPVPQLAFYRRKAHLSRTELAAKAGVSAGTVGRLESDGATAYHVTVNKLAEALGVEPEQLVKAEEREA